MDALRRSDVPREKTGMALLIAAHRDQDECWVRVNGLLHQQSRCLLEAGELQVRLEAIHNDSADFRMRMEKMMSSVRRHG